MFSTRKERCSFSTVGPEGVKLCPRHDPPFVIRHDRMISHALYFCGAIGLEQ